MNREKHRAYRLSIPEGYVIPVLTKNVECPLAESDIIKVDKTSRINSICSDLRSGAYAKHVKLTLDLGMACVGYDSQIGDIIYHRVGTLLSALRSIPFPELTSLEIICSTVCFSSPSR